VKTILIADDEPAIRSLLEIFLTDSYRVLLAASGEEALHLAREHMPDLALIDITMPKLSGIEVVRRLQDSPQTAGLPIILLSGWGSPDDVDVPIAAYLSKPFKRETLLQTVLNAFGEGISA
jgi:two-component system phosphate regulon response regulator PhoB